MKSSQQYSRYNPDPESSKNKNKKRKTKKRFPENSIKNLIIARKHKTTCILHIFPV
jgi:hypothetical protein